ncbi:YfdX family protein [Formicincola oecophyllae]|uniref:YfdX family protein n=1 Tax=Formicincola oecophyllae TaxID=2558361 RepID=A0A4Y6U707_9PROT|nr:YfdX family protein [Formicincola oecophyllae]QDH13173.1 YfdX family protein [Formicincola oecophyllae]
MSLTKSLRFLALPALLAGTTLAALPAVAADAPAAQPASAHQSKLAHPIKAIEHAWERHEARVSFRHLSVDGQAALLGILKAQQVLGANDTAGTIRILEKVASDLNSAGRAETKFMAAETDLHPGTKTAVEQANQKASAQTWIPVGGEFIASEELAPEKKAAIAKANTQLRAGQADEAQKTLEVVGSDLDFIIALAPLAPTEGDVTRALQFAKANQPAAEKAALNDALNALVFVSENFVTSMLPANAPSKAAPASAAPVAPAAPAKK